MSFGDVKTESGVKALNEFLADKSYLEGHAPTTTDTAIFNQLASAPDASYAHALRWYKHIASFSSSESSSFTAGTTSVQKPCPVKAGDADSDDPFGDDDSDDDDDEDEEETPAQKAHREKMEAMAKKKAEEKAAKGKKAPVVGKSEITLDVKPWDDETDMKKVEESVRSIQMEGLLWGASKLVPLAYGIMKLQIRAVVVDDLVSTDDMQEKIEAFDEYVQSTDIAAFNKI